MGALKKWKHPIEGTGRVLLHFLDLVQASSVFVVFPPLFRADSFLMVCLLHPTRLQHFLVAFPQCFEQTPLLTLCFLHRMWLQHFCVPPCSTHTPLLWTCLSPVMAAEFHPPCMSQSMLFWTYLLHPSWLQHFTITHAWGKLSCWPEKMFYVHSNETINSTSNSGQTLLTFTKRKLRCKLNIPLWITESAIPRQFQSSSHR